MNDRLRRPASSEEYAAHDKALHYMEWEGRYRPQDGDNRTPLQRKIGKMSLAGGWNYKTELELRNLLSSGGETSRKAAERLENGTYRDDNPYKEGGGGIFAGDYVYDEALGLLRVFEGWYHFLVPILTPVRTEKITSDKAEDLARENGRRLFTNSGNVYRQTSLLPELALAG